MVRLSLTPPRLLAPNVSARPTSAVVCAFRDELPGWLAEFRSDIESFIAREAVEACIAWGVRERPSLPNITYYRASAR